MNLDTGVVKDFSYNAYFINSATRTLAGVEIPPDVGDVTIEGRDLANGWGGATLTISLPRRDVEQ